MLLDWEQRQAACLELVAKLVKLDVEVVEACVTDSEFHILARFRPLKSPGMIAPPSGATMPGLSPANSLRDGRDPWPRVALGLAKKHAAHVLRSRGMSRPGGLWARRAKLEPVKGRAHQLRVVAYIRKHARKGAAVWSQIKNQRENKPRPR